MSLSTVKRALRGCIDPEYTIRAATFFKTGPGEYAEGEKFLGVRKPAIRQLAKQYIDLDYAHIEKLLHSHWHEEKNMAVFILLGKYLQQDTKLRQEAYAFYAKNRTHINNWDLVDDTAAKIIGHYHFHGHQAYPMAWIKEPSLWSRRIAIVGTHYYIKQQTFDKTTTLVTEVLDDREDLIHKAAGWMLREIGKQNREVLVNYLKQYATVMPRTMLRYAIEHFSDTQRKIFMTMS